MWRSFFLACGITILILGVECLGVEKVVLKLRGDPPPKVSPWDNEPKVAPPIDFTPPAWTPWSLMSSGIVVCLYSITIPKRMAG
jgi:hypothetical protein